jgi:hypothetical protein
MIADSLDLKYQGNQRLTKTKDVIAADTRTHKENIKIILFSSDKINYSSNP